MTERQRSEAYNIYVADSLFFLQHLLNNDADDENKKMFSIRYDEMIKMLQEKPKAEKQPTAEEIKERMIAKSMNL